MIYNINYKEVRMVTVIGTENCSRCKMVKDILTNKGIEFNYILFSSLSEDDKQKYLLMAAENKYASFPIILKDDKILNLQEV
jgi:glutaredoxin